MGGVSRSYPERCLRKRWRRERVYCRLHAPSEDPLKFPQFVVLDIDAPHLPARSAELSTRNLPEPDGPLGDAMI